MKKGTGKPLLAVDVDLTVVDSAAGWLDYLEYHSGVKRPLVVNAEKLPYDLSLLFPAMINPYNYWRELDYSKLKPIQGAVEKLQQLSEHFDIIFVSQIKGVHAKSKYYWLEEWFPFNKGVHLTKEKWAWNKAVVAMIDDRLDNLEGFDLCKRVLYTSPYSQGGNELLPVGYVIKDWKSLDVDNFVKYLGGCDE